MIVVSQDKSPRHPDQHTMDAKQAKGICIPVLFFGTFALGCLPVWLYRRGTLKPTGSWRKRLLLDMLNSFIGGVFLGSCLLHLLVEGREEFEAYVEEVQLHSSFPFYEALVGVGLFLVALVEKLGLLIAHKPSSVADSGHAGQWAIAMSAGVTSGSR